MMQNIYYDQQSSLSIYYLSIIYIRIDWAEKYKILFSEKKYKMSNFKKILQQ